MKKYTIQNTNKPNTDFKCIPLIINLIQSTPTLQSQWQIIENPTQKVTLSDNNKNSLIQIGYIDNLRILDKHNLALLYSEYYFIPPTNVYKNNETIYESQAFTKNDIYIIKPSSTFISHGDCIHISNQISKPKCNQRFIYWIAQLLIPNPLLINYHKIDLRIHTIVFYNSNNINVYMFKDNYARMSRSKYNYNQEYLSQVTNLSQISDMKEKKKYVFYVNKSGIYKRKEYLYKFKTKVFNEIEKILKIILKNELKYVLNQSNLTKGYVILGIDFIIDENENLYLIEVNDRAGIYPIVNLFKKYHETLFKYNILENFIDDNKLPIINDIRIKHLFEIKK